MKPKPLYTRFYEIIQQIPRGRVATYGQIANIAGFPGYARQVGYALNSLPEGIDIPWHRVINSRGMISITKGRGYGDIQFLMLEEEGVNFDNRNRVNLTKYQWMPERE